MYLVVKDVDISDVDILGVLVGWVLSLVLGVELLESLLVFRSTEV